MAEIDPSWWTSGTHKGRPMPEILAARDFGAVFAFLRSHGWSVGAISAATQIDEYPIREIIKGRRQVTAYEVIERIVVGLRIERHMCGVGVSSPASFDQEPIGGPSSAPVAICGSRAPRTDGRVIDAAIRVLARIVFAGYHRVWHGPVGVGIEVMTYIADHYRPPNLGTAIGVFGHQNVIRHADYVVVIGGGEGTQTEIDLALTMNKRILPLPASGGSAARFHRSALQGSALYNWLTPTAQELLDRCGDPDRFGKGEERYQLLAEQYARVVDGALAGDPIYSEDEAQ